MLTKQRQEMILGLLAARGSVTVTWLRDELGVSEATVRRDITALDQAGKLCKVFGGAVTAHERVTALEYTVEQKIVLHREEKMRIASHAASLITENDFVYMDAGTTTSYMIDCVPVKGVVFVTNAVVHAQRLAARGCKVYLIGGELKASTEAIVGNQAMQTLKNYHFTIGFFGVNGITRQSGCTTPDANEALIKQTAMKQTKKTYVLCDHSKFDQISPVTFAPFHGTMIVTDDRPATYRECGNIIVV